MDLKLRIWMVFVIHRLFLCTTKYVVQVESASQYEPYESIMDDMIVGDDISKWSIPNQACELTNACCGMDGQLCCPGGQQKCFDVWKRKCNLEDNPECRIIVDRRCKNVLVKDCRIVTEVVFKEFKASFCQPKPLRKCFTYKRKVCGSGVRQETRLITWINEKLQKAHFGGNTEEHCVDVDTFNCTSKVVPEVVRSKVRKEKQVPAIQRKCRMVRVKLPNRVITEPVSKITYKRECIQVRQPECVTASCYYGYCPHPQTACSVNEVKTQQVCFDESLSPLSPDETDQWSGSAMRQYCEPIQEPVCNDEIGGACLPGVQQCCEMKERTICRQVPVTVVEHIPRNVSGGYQFREECKDFEEMKSEFYWDIVNNTVKHKRQECQPVRERVCNNYTIPSYKVTTEKKTDSVTVSLPTCLPTTVTQEYCHVFPQGDVICQDRMVKHAFKIYKIKCDKNANTQVCVNIPKTECRLGTNTNCRMVKETVCQPTCSNTQLCRVCDDFRRASGFGTCPSSSCGVFYPGDDALNVTLPVYSEVGIPAPVSVNSFNDGHFYPVNSIGYNLGGTAANLIQNDATYIPGAETKDSNGFIGQHHGNKGDNDEYLEGTHSHDQIHYEDVSFIQTPESAAESTDPYEPPTPMSRMQMDNSTNVVNSDSQIVDIDDEV